MANSTAFGFLALAVISGAAFAISGFGTAAPYAVPDRWNGEVAAASAYSTGGNVLGVDAWAASSSAKPPLSFYGYVEAASPGHPPQASAFADAVYYFYAELL